MSFSVNYSGRSNDLLMFQGIKKSGDALISLSFGNEGNIITGVEKLAQSFTKLFLTERGTAKYHPEEGTGFVTAVRLGAIRSEMDVQSQFGLAVEAVRRILGLAAEQNDLPDDERFDTATLERFQLNKEAAKVVLYVKVVSAAGSSRVVYLPIPTAIP